MAGFMPPASPPLVSTAMLEGAVAVSVMTQVKPRSCPVSQSYWDDIRYVLYVFKGPAHAARAPPWAPAERRNGLGTVRAYAGAHA
jgi:hypothetical protein